MERTPYLVLATGLIALGSASCGTFADECFSGKECAGAFGSGGSSSTTSTTTSSASSMTSTSTGSSPSCMGTDKDILSPSTIDNFVNDDCGVFVRADAANLTGDGSKEKPYKTVQAAIDGANGKAIFVCANDPFIETPKASKALYIYGGFDCAKDWSWNIAARTTITGKADEVTFTVAKSVKDATIWNLAVKAPAATKDSGSSIAMAIDDVKATLTRCDVTAGSGKDGLQGTSYTVSAMAGATAPALSVADACVAPFAADFGKTMCDGAKTDGGAGGLGGTSGVDNDHGQTGLDGLPMGAGGKGGPGDGQTDSPSACMPGFLGTNGGVGKVGSKGLSSKNTLTLTGVMGGSGGDGNPGGAGQGGGGGGGARAGKFCGLAGNPINGFGAGGGGGGAGGCGGLGGGGGQLGGSSIAVLSLGTQLKLTEVTLTTGQGGKGGGGGLAQAGGDAGLGGLGGKKSLVGSVNGCPGGNGGDGGDGGNGGGGRGGHSIGVAFAGTPTTKLTLTLVGGLAGDGADGADKGVGGPTAACWDFATNATCSN
jgi:hypothetical protein